VSGIKYTFGTDLDDPARTVAHGELIRAKPFLRKVYEAWYAEIRSQAGSAPASGEIVEIGSGGGFLKEVIPGVITSDVMPLPGVDRCFPADRLPFEPSSLKAICMLNVLHHLPDPAAFFEKASDQLAPGGRIVMIEPANTPFSRFVYTRFHHEDFDPTAGWTLTGEGPLSVSNQALPWILFVRDRDRFFARFPKLAIRSLRVHTPLLYLLSGGLSYRALAPAWSFGLFTLLESAGSFANGLTGLFQTIVLEKK